MKFTLTNVNLSATSGSKIPCETASEKGYLTPAQIVTKGFPEEVTVNGITLGDQGEVVQSGAFQLIRNGPASIAFSDGVNPGGDIIAGENQFFNSVYTTSTDYAANNFRKVIGKIWIPARYAVPGAYVKMLCNGFILGNGANLANVWLGWVTATQLTDHPADNFDGDNFIGGVLGIALETGKQFQILNAADLGFSVYAVDSDTVKIFDRSYLAPTDFPMVAADSSPGTHLVIGAGFQAQDQSFEQVPFQANLGEGFYVYLVLDITEAHTATAITAGIQCKATYIDAP